MTYGAPANLSREGGAAGSSEEGFRGGGRQGAGFLRLFCERRPPGPQDFLAVYRRCFEHERIPRFIHDNAVQQSNP